MQGNILSPIFCNIYLNQLDIYMKGIISKYEKGTHPTINKDYSKAIGLKHEERKLPQHIQNKVKKSRRRQTAKLGIKRIVECADFIRIKYIRYADDFIIGVRGSRDLAIKIKELVHTFLKGSLHLDLNLEKTKITNTYSDRAKFLGFLIYNKNARDLPYMNSRSVENAKRVAKRNKIRKDNATKKLELKTRERLIKLWNNKDPKQLGVMKSVISSKNSDLYRKNIRDLAINVTKEIILEEINIKDSQNKGKLKVVAEKATITKLIPKQKPLSRIDIMKRIHKFLVGINAVSTDRSHSKRI